MDKGEGRESYASQLNTAHHHCTGGHNFHACLPGLTGSELGWDFLGPGHMHRWAGSLGTGHLTVALGGDVRAERTKRCYASQRVYLSLG